MAFGWDEHKNTPQMPGTFLVDVLINEGDICTAPQCRENDRPAVENDGILAP